MKIFAILAAFMLAVNALADEDRWNQFKIKFNKIYQSQKEHRLRFDIFKSNLRIIETHNAKYDKGEVSYFLGVNQFADLKNEEFAEIYLTPMLQQTRRTGNREGFIQAVGAAAVPDSIDWRDHGVVSEIRSQGDCGSCYSFSAISCLESQYAIKYKAQVLLSNQEIVDCSKPYGNKGCKGGWMNRTFLYIKDKGISTESSYPYVAKEGTCTPVTDAKVKVTGYKDVKSSQSALKDAVGTVGPIAATINGLLIQLYMGGIFDNEKCLGRLLDHAIVVAGYGNAEGKDYWLIQNSWTTTWGEQGYMRLIRNKPNDCGVHKAASFPIIA